MLKSAVGYFQLEKKTDNLSEPDFIGVVQKEVKKRRDSIEQFEKNNQPKLTDKEIEAVYIATPVHLHAVQTIAAAEAGKHVLCEKPMAMNVKECDEMIAACRANNVKLGIAYYRHFYPVIGRIKSVIQSGKVGTPVLVQINAFEWFDPKPEHARYWLVKKELAGGGPMFEHESDNDPIRRNEQGESGGAFGVQAA